MVLFYWLYWYSLMVLCSSTQPCHSDTPLWRVKRELINGQRALISSVSKFLHVIHLQCEHGVEWVSSALCSDFWQFATRQLCETGCSAWEAGGGSRQHSLLASVAVERSGLSHVTMKGSNNTKKSC